MTANPLTWLYPIEWTVSGILRLFHSLFSSFFDPDYGLTWGLSIAGLVVVIRIALIPLFVKQIRATRNMQLIQPQVQEIQKKYAGDRERQSQELMKLYRETGTNPLSSCLPILAQSPIFLALFKVLNGIGHYDNPTDAVPPGLTAQLTASAHGASLFGVPLYGTFTRAAETPNPGSTQILTLVLIALMSATTFITQQQLIAKNVAPGNPMVRQQKIMLYVFPIIFAISGVNFPIGVLLYWFTTNVWTMGQQFWVIRNSPQPGTPAFEAMQARKAKKGKLDGGTGGNADSGAGQEPQTRIVRNQPKRSSRDARRGGQPRPKPTDGSADNTPKE